MLSPFQEIGKTRSLQFVVVAVVAVMVATAGIAYANTPARTPEGFDKSLVYIAAGKYDPSIPPEQGDLAEWFHKDIMGRSDADLSAEKAAAEAYFESQFGPGLPEAVPFGVDPRNEYRVYYISGMDVPESGYEVRDGGFRVTIPEPGMTLYGEWGGPEGKFVPGGTFLVFGEYNIDVMGPGNSGKNPSHVEPIIIHYESVEPIVPDPINGVTTFRCTLEGPWGEGIAQGISKPIQEDGWTQANIRNILTFPPFGPSIVHDEEV